MIGPGGRCQIGVRGRVVTLVENGVDLSLWQQNDSRTTRLSATAPDRDIRFAFTGRLMEIKGVDFLLRAFAEVVKRVPEATLDILGDGEMRKPWETLAASLGLSGERVKFHGWVAQNKVPELLGKADALLLPSLHECGGAVVLEAMAMGLPVIATDWGGPADYIDPSCGILVPPQSHRAVREGFGRGDDQAGGESGAAPANGPRRTQEDRGGIRLGTEDGQDSGDLSGGDCRNAQMAAARSLFPSDAARASAVSPGFNHAI